MSRSDSASTTVVGRCSFRSVNTRLLFTALSAEHTTPRVVRRRILNASRPAATHSSSVMVDHPAGRNSQKCAKSLRFGFPSASMQAPQEMRSFEFKGTGARWRRLSSARWA